MLVDWRKKESDSIKRVFDEFRLIECRPWLDPEPLYVWLSQFSPTIWAMWNAIAWALTTGKSRSFLQKRYSVRQNLSCCLSAPAARLRARRPHIDILLFMSVMRGTNWPMKQDRFRCSNHLLTQIFHQLLDVALSFHGSQNMSICLFSDDFCMEY